MPSSLHHFHKRKRIHKKLEEYPSPNKWISLIDNLTYFVAIFGPIMTIPQVTKIWIDKNATGVSIISWVSYLIAAVFWLIYGIAHKEKPIIFANIIWIFLEILIITGTFIYG